jgi:methyltransferase (TIGR00027 family)
MARTGNDTWGPATSVGTTATMVATARALANRAGLIHDPFAEPLVSAVGLDFFTKVASGELALSDLGDNNGMALLTDLLAVRTRFFDNFVTEACRAGIRQVVILGSGLDARPYRLWWPAGTTVYDIDQPEVIDFKTQTLRGLGAVPAANRRAVGVDLRQDWPEALGRIGFDTTEPTVWIAEGLLIGFLQPATQDRLLDSVTALSAPGSRAAADYFPERKQPLQSQEHALADGWRPFGYRGDMAEFTYQDEYRDVAESLGALGWRTAVIGLEKLFTATGLPGLRRQDLTGVPVAGRYVRAVFTSRAGMLSTARR